MHRCSAILCSFRRASLSTSSQPLSIRSHIGVRAALGRGYADAGGYPSSATLQAELSSGSLPPGVTVVDSVEAAQRVVSTIQKLPLSTYHAWDTEVVDIDLDTQSPVGNGKVICASFFSGPNVDYGQGPRVWVNSAENEVRRGGDWSAGV